MGLTLAHGSVGWWSSLVLVRRSPGCRRNQWGYIGSVLKVRQPSVYYSGMLLWPNRVQVVDVEVWKCSSRPQYVWVSYAYILLAEGIITWAKLYSGSHGKRYRDREACITGALSASILQWKKEIAGGRASKRLPATGSVFSCSRMRMPFHGGWRRLSSRKKDERAKTGAEINQMGQRPGSSSLYLKIITVLKPALRSLSVFMAIAVAWSSRACYIQWCPEMWMLHPTTWVHISVGGLCDLEAQCLLL